MLKGIVGIFALIFLLAFIGVGGLGVLIAVVGGLFGLVVGAIAAVGGVVVGILGAVFGVAGGVLGAVVGLLLPLVAIILLIAGLVSLLT